MTEEEQTDVIYFSFYFFGTCFGVFFLIFLMFLCFSGRICIFIYYKVTRTSQHAGPHESTPLIVESDYFPRPGYDGYCLLGQEDSPPLVLERGIVLSHCINIEQGGSQSGGADTPGSGNYPRGILTPKRKRSTVGKGRSKPQDSLKSVSFNPKTEFQLV
eukprot:TRINITY_DN6605_c0_g1_i1.p1 TRINITY_DN6605_c0_g1~~TRINITY_DN6605_c0_g1_i1.p1  ORF type:complete len:159 (-),score=41.36 TRINITY_DN6605_c0_g1_i1:29-505(-)